MIDDGAELEGRYRILRKLGEGGMGTVYEAEHTALGKRIAIKMLHAHVAKLPDAVRRFAREARAAAEIGHPNIVEVFDTGTHFDEPFLVMELLRGETLADRLSRPEAVECPEACRILGCVLSALASAHAKGIIHRDLKPENVFLVDGLGAPGVKLLDFGISKFRRSGATLEQTTLEGIPLGTPAYMAPEQWMGRRDIDHRADLFAVGVMLYELLTGGLPYEGANQAELFLEIVRGDSVPAGPSALESDVPAALDAILLRALERDPARRFTSAREFLDALRPYGAGAIAVVDDAPAVVEEEDVTAVTQRRAMRAAPTGVGDRPRRLPLEVTGTLAVVLLAVGAGGWWFARSTPSSTAAVVRAPRPVAAAAVAAPVLPRAPTPTIAPRLSDAQPSAGPSGEPARVATAAAARPVGGRRVRRASREVATTASTVEVDRLPVSRSFEP
ncbi:MAG: Protein kinase [Myxococcaceae bacterium]|nr:Protein kinase [Myxococcaceae bacterium]